MLWFKWQTHEPTPKQDWNQKFENARSKDQHDLMVESLRVKTLKSSHPAMPSELRRACHSLQCNIQGYPAAQISHPQKISVLGGGYSKLVLLRVAGVSLDLEVEIEKTAVVNPNSFEAVSIEA
eukprot:837455-Amphidinium_carterae.1